MNTDMYFYNIETYFIYYKCTQISKYYSCYFIFYLPSLTNNNNLFILVNLSINDLLLIDE